MSKKKHKNHRPQQPNNAAPVEEVKVAETDEAVEQQDALSETDEVEQQAASTAQEGETLVAEQQTQQEAQQESAPQQDAVAEQEQTPAQEQAAEQEQTVEQENAVEQEQVASEEGKAADDMAQQDAVADTETVASTEAEETAVGVEEAQTDALIAQDAQAVATEGVIVVEDTPAAQTEEMPAAEKQADALAEGEAQGETKEDAAEDGKEENGKKGKEKKELTPEEKAALEAAKAAKKEKRKAWWKKNAKWVIPVALVLLILIGLTVAFFVITRDMGFVGKSEALDKALAKGKSELVLTKDVTYAGDALEMNGVSINLNGHTLTVSGIVKMTAAEGGSYIGKKATPWSKITNSGTMSCESLELYGATWTVYGTMANSVSYTDEGQMTLGGTIDGTLSLGTATVLDAYGSATVVKGGMVTAYDGATIQSAQNSKELVIYPRATVSNFDTNEYYYVYTLDAPKVWVVDNNEVYTCVIAKVSFAKEYKIVFAGEEKAKVAVTGDQVTYQLPNDVAPGDYTLEVTAQNGVKADHCLYLDSAVSKVKVKYYADLAQPTVNVEHADGKYTLKIGHVDNATQFEYSINGGKGKTASAASEGDTTVDLTEALSQVGSYTISVVAKHPKSNYNDSTQATHTMEITRALAVPQVGDVKIDGEGVLRFDATVDESASCLRVELLNADNVVYTAQFQYRADGAYSVALPKNVTASKLRVVAVGTRYYTDSEAQTVDAYSVNETANQ